MPKRTRGVRGSFYSWCPNGGDRTSYSESSREGATVLVPSACNDRRILGLTTDTMDRFPRTTQFRAVYEMTSPPVSILGDRFPVQETSHRLSDGTWTSLMRETVMDDIRSGIWRLWRPGVASWIWALVFGKADKE